MPEKPARPTVSVSGILRSLPENPELTQDARDAIRDGLSLDRYTPSPHCPCERCHRIYRTIP